MHLPLLVLLLPFTILQEIRSEILSSISQVLRKSRCLIPTHINELTKALLFQQCIEENEVSGNETACYDELGCFPMSEPWVNLLRPFPNPNSPARIDVKLSLYTRFEPNGYNVTLWPKISLDGSNFKGSREKTAFIIHGFASNGREKWLHEMKDAYLKAVDANVFIVDWGKGASQMNYLQVASNTRIVGAELVRFGKLLLSEENVGFDNIHVMGHSLGSHIASYMSNGLKPFGKIGRITALDPAQPGFEEMDPEVRISPDDAQFIDVLHTDARPFIPFIGFGMMNPVGHADFYINGGSGQPGCLSVDINDLKSIRSISDLARVKVEVISRFVSCSHGRSYEIFTSALLAGNCTFWGRKMPLIETFLKVGTLGKLALADPIVNNIDKCNIETCSMIGLITPLFKSRGYFASSTKGKPPYCESDTEKSRNLKNLVTGELQKVLNGVKLQFSNIFKKPKQIVKSFLSRF